VSLRSAVNLFRGQREFHMDLVGKRRIWFLLSAAAAAVSIVALLTLSLNLSIDFRGGSLLEFHNERGATVEEMRAVLARTGQPDAVVQLVEGPGGEETVTVRTEPLGEERTEIVGALEDRVGPLLQEETIGPRWGEEISAKALQALVIFLVVVSIYIAFRFEWKMAVAALVALFHDLLITAGVYSLSRQEVTPETVIALLTILGYSLYDTVVIFDKIKENTESLSLVARETYSGTVNLSLNQVFMRSINTSLATLLPVGALLLFGGETLQHFAFALFVGLVLGAYSSVFLAAPLVAVLKEREPRLAEIRQRAARREMRPALRAVPAEGPSEEKALEPATATATRASTATATRQAVRRKPKKKPRSKRRRK
jgi:preprotein translocase subunit SecF